MTLNHGKIEHNYKSAAVIHSATGCEGEPDGVCAELAVGRHFVALMAGLPYLKHYDRHTTRCPAPPEWAVLRRCDEATASPRFVGWGFHGACLDGKRPAARFGIGGQRPGQGPRSAISEAAGCRSWAEGGLGV